MHFGRYGTSHWLMRLGLGITFVWIGVDIFRNPTSWIGYLPSNIPFGLTPESALQLIAIDDVVIGCLFIVSKLPRLAAVAAVGHLAGILIVNGIDSVLIRDVGLLGVSLALLFWPQRGNRKKGWLKLFKRKRHYSSYEEE